MVMKNYQTQVESLDGFQTKSRGMMRAIKTSNSVIRNQQRNVSNLLASSGKQLPKHILNERAKLEKKKYSNVLLLSA
jgi:hypothetical protein